MQETIPLFLYSLITFPLLLVLKKKRNFTHKLKRLIKKIFYWQYISYFVNTWAFKAHLIEPITLTARTRIYSQDIRNQSENVTTEIEAKFFFFYSNPVYNFFFFLIIFLFPIFFWHQHKEQIPGNMIDGQAMLLINY